MYYPKNISFVIPCYNSSCTIGGVIAEIEESVSGTPFKDNFEIIAVVDGSPDDVSHVVEQLMPDHQSLKLIELSRNFGQANALMAGYHYASGDVIITLDDDGQCPVNDFMELIRPIQEGYDMAVARYAKKKQSWFKNAGSTLNQLMARWIIGLPNNFEMSNFYAFDRLVCNRIIQYENPYPYLSGLAFQATTKITNVPMEERTRVSGSSNYTLSKLISLWANGFTSFSIKPLRLATVIGLICALGGFMFGLIVIIQKILNADIAAGYPSLISSIFFIGGIIMILLGAIGEYVGRIFICLNNTPQFLIRKVAGFDSKYQKNNAMIMEVEKFWQ